MAGNLCPHLEDYAAQFARTEAAYRHCLSLIDRILADGPGNGLAGLVSSALAEWASEDTELREQFVALVMEGRTRIPLALVRGRWHGDGHERPPGTVVCATCGGVVPRLECPEWKIAHNGAVTYRDVDFGAESRQPA